MIYVTWRKLILTILNSDNNDKVLIKKACKRTGKTKQELDNLDMSVKACTTSIYKCICRKCPSLNMCYDGLEVKE